MNTMQNRNETLEDFLKQKKVKPAMAGFIRDELAVGERPMDFGTFYRGKSYWIFLCFSLSF